MEEQYDWLSENVFATPLEYSNINFKYRGNTYR